MAQRLSDAISTLVKKISNDKEPVVITKKDLGRWEIDKLEKMVKLVFGTYAYKLILKPYSEDCYIDLGNGFYICIDEDITDYMATKKGKRVKQILSARITLLKECKNCREFFEVDALKNIPFGAKYHDLNLRLLAEAIAEHLDDEELCPECRETTYTN